MSGNFTPYLISYTRIHSHPRDIRTVDGTYLVASQFISFSFGILLGGLLEKKLGPRVVTLLGGFTSCVGTSAAFYLIDKSFYFLLVTYGFFEGTGIGIIYIATLGCAMKWLPRYKGIGAGIVSAGTGAGALFFDVLQTSFINQHNRLPDCTQSYFDGVSEQYYTQQEILIRVKIMFLVTVGCYVVLLAIGSLFLCDPHPSYQQYQRTKTDITRCSNGGLQMNNTSTSLHMIAEKEKLSKSDDDNNDESIAPKVMVKRLSFYVLWIKCCIGSSISTFILSLYKTFGLEMVTQDDIFLATVGAGGAVSTILGKLIFGVLQDYTDNEVSMVLQSGTLSFFLLTMYATSAVGRVMYFIWVCVIFFAIGGFYSLIASVPAVRYGEKHMLVNYGLINTGDFVAQILATLFSSQYIIDQINWYGVFLLFGGVSTFDFILATILHYIK